MEFETDFNTYKQVLTLAKTPTTEEFLQIAGIAGAGITLIGFVGFLIYTAMSFLPA